MDAIATNPDAVLETLPEGAPPEMQRAFNRRIGKIKRKAIQLAKEELRNDPQFLAEVGRQATQRATAELKDDPEGFAARNGPRNGFKRRLVRLEGEHDLYKAIVELCAERLGPFAMKEILEAVKK